MDPEGVWEMQRHEKHIKTEKAEPSSKDPSGLQLLQEALVSPSGPMGTHKVVCF